MLGNNAAAQSSAQANRLQAAQWSLHGQGSGITADLAVLYGLECNLHQVAPNLALWASLREFFSASHKDVETQSDLLPLPHFILHNYCYHFGGCLDFLNSWTSTLAINHPPPTKIANGLEIMVLL